MHGALHGTPCALESGRDVHSVFGKPRLAGHALLRCRTRALSSRRTIARPTRETSPSPFGRCAPTAFLDVSRAVESSTARPRPPLLTQPVKAERRARSGTSSIERFHRSGASSPKTLSMPMRSLTALRRGDLTPDSSPRPGGSTPACADPDWVLPVRAPDASQRRDAARSPLRVSRRGGWPRARDLAAAILGPTSVRFGGFGPFRYPVDAALRFPSALHVPASTSSFDFYRYSERGH